VSVDAVDTNLDVDVEVDEVPTLRIHKQHPLENIIEDIASGVQTRNKSVYRSTCLFVQIRDTVLVFLLHFLN
jgi:hypothetical protein